MHITASVFINDDEGGLHADYEEWLEGLAPHEPISRYRHNRTGEDNGDAHLKRQIMGFISDWGRVFEFASFADLILEVSILSLSKDAVYKAKEDSFDDPSPFDKLRLRRERSAERMTTA